MRQFILQKNPDKDGLVQFSGKDYRYLCQVLRAKQGDMLNLRLPNGELQTSTVVFVDSVKKTVTVQVCANPLENKTITRGVQASELSSDGLVEYWLFQFIPKPQKFEQIVRQATECGIKMIVPIISDYAEKGSVAALKGAKKDRIEKIIREARQQSGSPVETVVHECVTLEEACALWNEVSCNDSSLGIVLSERDEFSCNLGDVFANYSKKNLPKRVCIAVGNEGGVSPSEIDFLLKKGLFMSVHFVVNILRCETAALYGIAAVQSFVNSKTESEE